MLELGQTQGFGEIPLFALADADLFAILGWDIRSHFGGLHQAALELDLAVALQGPYVAALMTMDVIETLDTAEVAVEGEIARDLSEHDPVHELFEQLGMALEGRCPSPLPGACESDGIPSDSISPRCTRSWR